MTIDQVLAIEDKSQLIEYLKKGRRTEQPDKIRLYNDCATNQAALKARFTI